MNLRKQRLPEMNGVSGFSTFSFPLPFPGEKKANNRIIAETREIKAVVYLLNESLSEAGRSEDNAQG